MVPRSGLFFVVDHIMLKNTTTSKVWKSSKTSENEAEKSPKLYNY